MSFLDRIAPFLWIVVGICIIGLASEVFGIMQDGPSAAAGPPPCAARRRAAPRQRPAAGRS